eukprot:COSAG02_NODE_63292_length_263_cov_1.042683_1_plen_65_part_01
MRDETQLTQLPQLTTVSKIESTAGKDVGFLGSRRWMPTEMEGERPPVDWRKRHLVLTALTEREKP